MTSVNVNPADGVYVVVTASRSCHYALNNTLAIPPQPPTRQRKPCLDTGCRAAGCGLLAISARQENMSPFSGNSISKCFSTPAQSIDACNTGWRATALVSQLMNRGPCPAQITPVVTRRHSFRQGHKVGSCCWGWGHDRLAPYGANALSNAARVKPMGPIGTL